MMTVAGASDRIRLVDAATVQCGSPDAQATRFYVDCMEFSELTWMSRTSLNETTVRDCKSPDDIAGLDLPTGKISRFIASTNGKY